MSILKARWKIQYDSVRKQGKCIVVIKSIYIFLVKRNFSKKGVIVSIGALHKRDLLISRRKKSRFSFFDATHQRAIWHED